MSFANKIVLVTGGSSGIGATTAIMFAKEGADVAIVGRNETNLNKVAEECNKVGKRPLIIKADLSKNDDAKAIVEKTIDTYGKLDVLVNNAGILNHGSILGGDFLKLYDEAMDTNMRPVVLITTLAAPHLIETKGNVINVSSIAGLDVSQPNFLSYRMSKAALNHFSLGAASELAPFGVRVNIVSPGPVETDIFATAGMSDIVDHLKDATALNRISESQEIADMILYLASDRARGITGSNFVIDNGQLLK